MSSWLVYLTTNHRLRPASPLGGRPWRRDSKSAGRHQLNRSDAHDPARAADSTPSGGAGGAVIGAGAGVPRVSVVAELGGIWGASLAGGFGGPSLFADGWMECVEAVAVECRGRDGPGTALIVIVYS